VANGRKVKIWKDSWLLGQSNPKSCCLENTLFGEATVSELIDEDLKRWNVNPPDQVFSPYEAGIISQFPACCCPVSFQRTN